MRIQCNVCEAAEAKVLCCADEAALCWECDDKVHAANKLASKHQRVPLSSSSTQMPKCDICQETSGFFFCLQDRALLCRKCDVAIHTANSYVSAHQRFLLTGVKVALEPADPGASSSSIKSLSGENILDTKSHSLSRRDALMPVAAECKEVLPASSGGVGGFAMNKVSFAGGSAAGSTPSWHMDDFLALPELNQNYSFMDNGSSKSFHHVDDENVSSLEFDVDQSDPNDTGSKFIRFGGNRSKSVSSIKFGGKRGDSDSSSILRSAEEELDDDECLGQVPEASWAVPQIPSPPTASGLYWPKNPQNQYDSAFVPDIHHHSQLNRTATRRRLQ
ncbi:B-box zinc finger protein 22 [Citrus sinensis]|uniref:B-box zinc finger protein 22 n=1 Tax=Citrus sinensis TaxID=2711 RepID=A0ACB8M1M9_CITSI|nr:B-box zinc finger protein 22 [Citrus sinensis]